MCLDVLIRVIYRYWPCARVWNDIINISRFYIFKWVRKDDQNYTIEITNKAEITEKAYKIVPCDFQWWFGNPLMSSFCFKKGLKRSEKFSLSFSYFPCAKIERHRKEYDILTKQSTYYRSIKSDHLILKSNYFFV